MLTCEAETPLAPPPSAREANEFPDDNPMLNSYVVDLTPSNCKPNVGAARLNAVI